MRKEIINIENVTIDELHLPELSGKNLHADILRLDKIHSVISGNKWFKLKYYLKEAAEKKCKTIITFGGAYSNHIIATAYAAKELKLKSIGIIRGEESNQLSHTLVLAKEYGMNLIFISRSEYSQKDDEDFINDLCMNEYKNIENDLCIIRELMNELFETIITQISSNVESDSKEE